MTQEPNGNHTELRRLVRMLEKTASMAEHASLTGSMAGGKEFAVRSYNSVVGHLANTGEIPAGLFASLPDDANLDAVGIASAQLAEYLRAGLPEPEQQKGKGNLIGGDGFVINVGGLGDVADLVREHLPEWLRGKIGQSKPEPGETDAPETAASPETPDSAAGSGPGHAAAAPRPSLPPRQARIEELRPERQQAPH